MGIPGDQFGPEFFTVIGGMVFAFFGVIIRYAYRSKCRTFDCCCVHVEREVDDEMIEDIESMERGVGLPGTPREEH